MTYPEWLMPSLKESTVTPRLIKKFEDAYDERLTAKMSFQEIAERTERERHVRTRSRNILPT
jgi:hypothetical protein